MAVTTTSKSRVTADRLAVDGAADPSDGDEQITAWRLAADDRGLSLPAAQSTGFDIMPRADAALPSPRSSGAVTDAPDIAGATVAAAVVGNILTVGSGKQFSTVAAAIAAAHDGDTIQVDAGTYTNDFAAINKDITLEGVGGMVEMVCTVLIGNGKAIFVTDGDITISNFTFSGARVADENGAGIRYQSGNLVLNNTAFFDNEDGLLGANDPAGSITINSSEFAYNGIGDGFTHNLYVGQVGNLTINDSYFHDVNVGHQVKSRALNTTIQNSRIYDGETGTGSYSIDLPNGGNVLIQNNVIAQGPLSENPTIIAIGEEGGVYAGTDITISGNTILHELASPSTLAVWNATSATAQITGNEFFGLTSGQIASGLNSQSGNSFLASEPALDTSSPWLPDVACFCRGTRIRTPGGDVPVEGLAVGDLVMTATGEARPIKWIGRRSYDGRFVAGNRGALPIRIEAGALADRVPMRDLLVSPEHALVIDGLFLPARLLVNGATVSQVDRVDRLDYFHIELDTPDVIFAEGAAAETFLDFGGRAMFHNSAEFAALYLGAMPADWDAYAALLARGEARLPEIRARLLARARRLGRVSRDPGLHLIVDGRSVRPATSDGRTHCFWLPAGAHGLAIASHSVVPSETEAASCDERRLGVPVERIVVRGAGRQIEIGPDSPLLRSGFHRDEETHRWTDGHGSLASGLLGRFAGEIVVEVRIGPTELHYPVTEPPAASFSPRRATDRGSLRRALSR